MGTLFHSVLLISDTIKKLFKEQLKALFLTILISFIDTTIFQLVQYLIPQESLLGRTWTKFVYRLQEIWQGQ